MNGRLLLAAAVVSLGLAQAPAQQPAAPEVDLATVMAHASRWTARFDKTLSGLLFRERYSQRVTYGGGTNIVHADRIIEANVFLLKLPGARDFVLFRDTYKVNDDTIGDHTKRLDKLMAAGANDDALKQARRLTDASARHNIGRTVRNVNVPTMPFDYLSPGVIGGIRVRIAGGEKVAGLDTVIVEFEEVSRPTLVRADNVDVPAKGRYWVHAASGAVPRAEVHLEGPRTRGRIRIELMLHPSLMVWVPKQMDDEWAIPNSERVTAQANYDNFKRLGVATAEKIK